MAGLFRWRSGSGGNVCMEICSCRPLGVNVLFPLFLHIQIIFGLPGSG